MGREKLWANKLHSVKTASFTGKGSGVRNFLQRIGKPLFYLVAGLTLAEEWLWDHLKVLAARIAAWPLFRSLEALLRRAPPPLAALLLLLPGVVLLPAKLLGLWLLAQGRLAAGAAVFVAAKLIGMALISRLYAVLRPALTQMAWFRRIESWILALVRWAHDWIHRQPAYRNFRTALRFMRMQWRRWRRAGGQAGV